MIYNIPVIFELPLSSGKIAIIDIVDYDLSFIKWSVLQSGHKANEYAHRQIKLPDGRRSSLLLHRVILGRVLGRELVKGEIVDHIDGNGFNNTRRNLRLATHQENIRNSRKYRRTASGYKGVHWNKQSRKWQAEIIVNGKEVYLGRFNDALEAHEAYCAAAIKYFGEFARFK